MPPSTTPAGLTAATGVLVVVIGPVPRTWEQTREETSVAREGIDYSWHHGLNLDAFRQAGVSFVIRYLSNDTSKNLNASEAHLLSDGGFDLAVVWETTAKRALSGRKAGEDDAAKARKQAKTCGMPAGRPIYFAVDWDATDREKPTIAEYLKGAASVIGKKRVGVYGGYWVVKYCLDNAVASYGWQTYAWSSGQRDQRAQLYQHHNGVIIGGVNCDKDTAYAADFGQWRVRIAEAPAFPYPNSDYLGTPRPDIHCHSGVDAIERQHVAKWQKRMADRGWRIEANGIFNRQSERVCRSFQAEKGIQADGLVHPATWAKAWTAPVT
jgi:peptidoglycan hydrolase-like protein with peptidoglycan-binding domain